MNEPTKRRRRRQTTHPKRIYLTEPGEEQIQRWADESGITFSAANESLAALGADDPRLALVRTVSAVLREELAGIKQELQALATAVSQLEIKQEALANKQATQIKNQKAIASRVAYTTRTAAIIQHLVEELLLQVVRQTAESHPDDFVVKLHVNTEKQRGKQVVGFLEELLEEVWTETYDSLAAEAAWALDDVEDKQ
ncbi:MAG: hypothetical protein WAM60_09690 [Candidatus Promineifilaceae bacterium]